MTTGLVSRSRQRACGAALAMMVVLGCGDDSAAPDREAADAGSPSGSDAAAPSDAAASDSVPTLNGCTPAMYVDRSAVPGVQTIQIEGSSFSYSPKCLLVARGTTVRWQGSLSAHPLKAGPVAGSSAGSAGSPILETDTGDTVEFTFGDSGTYPYFCTLHAPIMAGSIHVK